jgi:hypothetical protein
MEIGATFAMEWEDPKPTDHSTCYECKGIIFGAMYQGHFFVNNVATGGGYKLCEDCYFEMKNGE